MEAATADGGSCCRLTSFMMCRRGSRPKSVRQDTGRRILSIRWKTHTTYS